MWEGIDISDVFTAAGVQDIVSMQCQPNQQRLPEEFNGDRQKHGKKEIACVYGYITPVAYLLRSYKSRSAKLVELLSTVYRFWTLLLMVDYYGNDVEPSKSPFENLWIVYNAMVQRRPSTRDIDVERALQGLRGSQYEHGTPFDSNNLNYPLELCLPEEVIGSLRTRLSELLNSRPIRGISTPSTREGSTFPVPSVMQATDIFLDWFRRCTKRYKQRNPNSAFPWPQTATGLPLGAYKVGVVKYCQRLSKERKKTPLMVERIVGGVKRTFEKSHISSALSYFTSYHEACIIGRLDAWLAGSRRWQRVAYVFDSLILKPPSLAPAALENALRKAEECFDETMYRGVTFSHDKYEEAIVPGTRLREIESSDDEPDVAMTCTAPRSKRRAEMGELSRRGQTRRRAIRDTSDDEADDGVQTMSEDANEEDSGIGGDDSGSQQKKSRSKVRLEFDQKCAKMIDDWAQKHGAWRETHKNMATEGVRIWLQIEGTKAYTNLIHVKGAIYNTVPSTMEWVNIILQEMDSDWCVGPACARCITFKAEFMLGTGTTTRFRVRKCPSGGTWS